ncbi:MAG: hypothetical protein LBR70_04250 [Lactobacillaceae bacterium]|jgi:hypothetical protein|nr:hypothetical protein [Lactobacillaceae bacterium]
MLNKLGTVAVSIPLGEVRSTLYGMDLSDPVKNEILIHLQGIQNSKANTFMFVHNGVKNGYSPANITLMRTCSYPLDCCLVMEGLRGCQDGVEYRVLNFIDTQTRQELSWVFQAVC